MAIGRRLRLSSLLLVAALSLSACDSAEERAEKHFQAGMELLEKGDVDRALVEFRNVFQLNGAHKDARLTYARIERERGQLREAYGQYLRLIEFYSDNLEARIALAEMAIDMGDWPEAERHGREAVRLAPNDPVAKTIVIALDYRKATDSLDEPGQKHLADEAGKIVADTQNPAAARTIAHMVRVDFLVSHNDLRAAITELTDAIRLAPDRLAWHLMRLRLLSDSHDTTGVGAALQQANSQFPESAEVRSLLIAWYVDQGNIDGAEDILRKMGAAQGVDQEEAQISLFQFLVKFRGPQAARVELDKAMAQHPDSSKLAIASAALDFDLGKHDEAIAAMRALAEGLSKDDARIQEYNDVRGGLAQLLQAVGDTEAARSEVDAILAADASNVTALKLQGAWLIDEDKPGDAIVALRTALDQNPRDPEILTLLGQAHERDGAHDLAMERYGLAVEASGRAPAESLRYARLLQKDGRLAPAETVLIDALTVTPNDLELLGALAEVRMRDRNWDGVEDSIALIRAVGTLPAKEMADRVKSQLLLRQEKINETITFLQSEGAGGQEDTNAIAAVVQAEIKAGRLESARDFLDEKLVADPANANLRFLRAGVHVLLDEPDQAEAIYRSLIAELPLAERPVQALHDLLQANGDAKSAAQVLDEGLRTNPKSPALRLMKAGELESVHDYAGALAIYEALYEEKGNNLIIANNYAAALTLLQREPAQIDRAFAIARRLRGTSVPAFQDTYGWIEYLRGNHDEALAYLEPAARSLAKDANAQAHLGLTYAALGRAPEATEALKRAMELAGGGWDEPQFAEARAALAKLASSP